MENVKIEFSQDELRALIDMVSIADWVMTACDNDPDGKFPAHEAARIKIASHAVGLGMTDQVEYDENSDDYCETADYEEKIQDEVISPYNNHMFWDELIDGLAKRDLIRVLGKDEYRKLGFLECGEQLDIIRGKYCQLFAEHNLNCIDVLAPPPIVTRECDIQLKN